MDRGRLKALTLIELLIAISISSLLGVATVLMLKSSLDAFMFSEEQTLIFRILDDTIEEVSGESMRSHGIKDALEIQDAKEDEISFSCLWIDESKRVSSNRQTYALNRPFKLGSPMPLVEFKPANEDNFLPSPVTFVPHAETEKKERQDKVILGEKLPAGSQLKIAFQPETKDNPDVLMRLKWDPQRGGFVRTYMNKKEFIPKGQFKGYKLTNAKFQYFDNSNNEIPSPVAPELLSTISAVRLSLDLEEKGREEKHQANTFINLRNSRAFGKGIIVREGLRLKIPDSGHIRTLSLGNITGVDKGDIIQLLAIPASGKSWRVTAYLGIKDDLPVIRSYTIEYPPGLTVYSENINLTLDLPFNLLDIGGNGRYDYDFDKDASNAVNLEGDVILTVEKMTAQGAALFVRP